MWLKPIIGSMHDPKILGLRFTGDVLIIVLIII